MVKEWYRKGLTVSVGLWHDLKHDWSRILAAFARGFNKPALALARASGEALPPQKLPQEGSTRYTVHRWVNPGYFLLYDGPSGAQARQAYEGVVARREMGTMKFVMTTHEGESLRGTYERLV